jgi:ketosteroid isomerase-like protein
MSQDDVETVKAAFEGFAGRGPGAFADHWTDDLKHRAIEGAPDDVGPINGKDALRAYIQDWLDTFDDFKNELVELIDAGNDKVIAVTRASGRAKLSGVSTDLTFATVYTIRDGKIAEGREYATKGEALEATGLSE